MNGEAQFQDAFSKALALCPGDSLPRLLAKDLSLADARHLEPLLQELHIPVPWTAEELPPIQQIAHRCARVIDWATDEEWCPGSQDWRPLARQIQIMVKNGVPAAPLTMTVLAARVINARRKQLHDGSGSSTATFVESGRDDEENHARLIRNVTKSVEALHHKIRGAKELAANGEDIKHKPIDGSRPFWPMHIHMWWRSHGRELVALLRDLDSSLEADRASFQARLSARAQFTPGDGHREGRYPATMYDAFEIASTLVSRCWRKYGAVTATRRLFGAVGIDLADDSIRKARQRKREATS